jgi:phosphoenolpyruvate-protein phosphotransferase (PTS system enzyme I)
VRLEGVPAAPGLAFGPAFAHAPDDGVRRGSINGSEVEEELSRFRDAVGRVVEKLGADEERLRAEGREEAAQIIAAHAELAADPELAESVEARVRDLASAEAAVLEAGEEFAGVFAAMEDEYMAARAEDVRDVSRQISAEISGRPSGLARLERPSVVVAETLTPSETARLREGMALGFVTATGSRTSHVAIMARAAGIPAVVGVGPALREALNAQTVAVDGEAGLALADPDPEILDEFRGRMEERRREEDDLERHRHAEARTRDGRHIEVVANLGADEEAEAALEAGAEGVGLFRTEFLFMGRDEPPDEEEQLAAYGRVAETFGERPVMIRTLDVGGDKPVPGVERVEEENPFLGWRGIRMSLEKPDLFKPQLRAILRSAARGNVKVMFPMVADAREFAAARAILNECREELAAERVEFGTVEAGVMIEVPSAALRAGELAAEADFFSVGTNDLTQYALAADRGNPRLAPYLQDAGHPAVLDLIRATCEAAREAGIPVGVCGEAAGDPGLAPALIEAGVTELSMAPPAIARIKKLVSEL